MIKSKKQQKRFNHKKTLRAAVCALVLAGSLGWSADASAVFVQNDSSKNNIDVNGEYVYGTKRLDGSLQNNNLLVTGNKPSSGTYATYNQTHYAGAYGYASYTYSEDEGFKLHDVFINNNTLTLSNISTPSISKVYGGYVAISGDSFLAVPTASGNTLIIDNVNFDAREGVYGGYALFGNTDNNTVLIKGGTVACPVYGAYSYGSPVLYGIQGQAYNNKVIIDGATVNLSVYGADVWGTSAPSGGNSVVINAGTVNGYVYGAYSASRLNAVHNTVTVNQNSTVNDTIYGGYGLGSGNENTVSITASVLATVYGGYGKTDDGNNNVVNIDWDSQGPVGQNSVVKGSVYGGYGVDDALSNNVNVAGLVKGSVYGGYGVENALSNNVNVAGLVEGSVYGGYGKNLRANDNIVNITSQVKGSVYGGYGPIFANDNTVTINNGDIQATVYGGYVEGNISTGNVVNIVGSSIAKDVYAGYAVTGAPKNNIVNLIGKGGELVYNETLLTGNKVITIGGTVYGSNNGVNGTLNLSGTQIAAKNVQNFANINFDLAVADTASILHTTDKMQLQETKVKVNADADKTLGSLASQGSVYKATLLDNGEGFNLDSYETSLTATSSSWVKKLEGSFIVPESSPDTLNFMLSQYTGNDVTLNAAIRTEPVYGGYGVEKDAAKNSVILSGGTFNAAVYGGYSLKGAAQKNSVRIENAQLQADIYGGKGDGAGIVSGNRVEVNSNNATINGSVYGGWGNDKTEYNTVVISDGTVKGSVYGGLDNKDGASGNTVIFTKGKVEKNIYGGYAARNDAAAAAANNTVTLAGGVSNGNVYGGYSVNTAAVNSGNTVNLVGKCGSCDVDGETITGSALKLGNVAGSNTGSAGNTLNVYGSGIQVGSIANFEQINIHLDDPKNIGAQGVLYLETGSCNIGSSRVKLYADADRLLEDSSIFSAKITHGIEGIDFTNKVDYEITSTDEARKAKLEYGFMAESSDTTFIISQYKDNTVTVSKNTQAADFYGGYSINTGKTVAHNSLTINNCTISKSNTEPTNVYGGYSKKDSAVNNAVALLNSTVVGTVYGGKGSIDASGNNVEVKGGSVVGNIYGGVGNEIVDNNNIKVTGDAKVTGNVYGSYSYAIDILSNSVELDGCAVTGDVYGGYGENYTPTLSNMVTVKAGTVEGAVYGGYGNNVSDSTVTVQGGKITGSVYGSLSMGRDTMRNIVNIEGGIIEESIYGGKGPGTARNEVTIAGGTVKLNVYGGFGEASSAEINSVMLVGGTVNSTVYGGYSGAANGNTVTLAGSTVTGDIYGGYGQNMAIDNTVNLIGKDGSAVVDDKTISGSDKGINMNGAVYGSNCSSERNTLNVYGTNITVGKVENFDTVNLYLASPTDQGKAVFNSSQNSNLSASSLKVSADVDKLMGTSAYYSATIMDGFTGITDNYSCELISADKTRKDKLDYDLRLDSSGAAQRLELILSQYRDNTANITKDMQVAKLFGGYGFHKDKVVANNSLIINGCNITGIDGGKADVYGGYSDAGSVEGNVATIAGSTVDGNVYAGYSESGTVGVNTVNLLGKGGSIGDLTSQKGVAVSGTVSGSNKGNTGVLNVYGSDISVGQIENFKDVNLYLTSVNENNKAIFQSTSNSSLANSSLSITADADKLMGTSGLFSSKIMTGFSGIELKEINYTLKTVTRAGKLDSALSMKGEDVLLTISQYRDNTAIVSSDLQTDAVYGGYGFTQTAENNSLTLSGCNITGVDGGKADVYGGYSEKGQGINNTVNLVGRGGSCVVGSESVKNPDKDITIDGLVAGSNSVNTGNVLNVYGTNIKVGEIQNFETINLYVDEAALSGTMLTTTSGNDNKWLNSSVNIIADADKLMGVSAMVDLTILNGYFQIDKPNYVISSAKLDELDYYFSPKIVSGKPEWHLVISQCGSNVVNIEGDYQGKEILGGYADDKAATYNTVNIKNGSVGGKTEAYNINIYGGRSQKGGAEHNAVSVENASVHGHIYGGGGNGNIVYNTVSLKKATVKGSVEGGSSMGNGSVNNNRVTVLDSSVSGDVYGGRSLGEVSGNTVTLAGSTVGGAVYGGYNVKGTALDNTVNLVGKNGSCKVGSETIVGNKGVTVTGAVGGTYKGVSGTLNVYGTDISVGKVENFEKVNLYLETAGAESKAVLTSNTVSDLSQSMLRVVADVDKLLGNSNYYNSVIMSGFSGIDATKNFEYEIIAKETDRKDKLELGIYQEQENARLLISQYKDCNVAISEATKSDAVYGGYATAKSAVNNFVTISQDLSGKKDKAEVYGGYSFYGGAEKNAVTVSAGVLEGNLYGGYSNGKGLVQHNSVTIANNVVDGNIYGGFSKEGTTADNVVNLLGKDGKLGALAGSEKGLTVEGVVYGSNKDNSGILNAYGTEIEVEQVQNFANINLYLDKNWKAGEYALYSAKESDLSQSKLKVVADADQLLGDAAIFRKDILSGFVGVDNAKNFGYELNTKDAGRKELLDCGVIQANDTVTLIISQYKDRNVTINETMQAVAVYGGYAVGKTATNNTVTIKGGNLYDSTDYMGMAPSAFYGGYSMYGGAAGNTVAIEAGDLRGSIYGGYGKGEAVGNLVGIAGGEVKGDVYGGYSADGLAKDNVVELGGNNGSESLTINGDVYAGFSKNSSADNNTVNIIGLNAQPQGRSSAALEGLRVTGTIYGSNTAVNGTLNVYGKASNVGNIANFANVNFYLDKNLQNGDTMLDITEAKPTELQQTTVNVNIKDTQLRTGNTVNLLRNYQGLITGPAKLNVNKGTLLTMDASASLSEDGHRLILTIESDPYANDTAKSLAETRLAAMGLVNGSVDFFNSVGLKEAMGAVQESGKAGKSEVEPFAAVGSNKFRYKTGSHVDMNSWNANVGVAKKFGSWVVGLAVEQAKGSYDTYMDNGLHANGNVKNAGAVLFAKKSLAKGWYGDVQLSAGRNKSSCSATVEGNAVHYDDSVNYYGTAFTVGKKLELSSKSTVDIYGRYSWSHLHGSDVTVDIGESMCYSGVDSHRLTLGGRWRRQIDKANQLYVGMAWQYEFSGDADARAIFGNRDYAVAAPSLKGHSGMLELGWKAKAGKNLSVDVNASGWTGKQKGVTGSVGLEWKF